MVHCIFIIIYLIIDIFDSRHFQRLGLDYDLAYNTTSNKNISERNELLSFAADWAVIIVDFGSPHPGEEQQNTRSTLYYANS